MYSELKGHALFELLYQQAQSWPEHKTTALWEYYLNKGPFNKLEYSVASQQPRSNPPGDLSRMDIQISTLANEDSVLFHLMPTEAKKHAATLTDFDTVELQTLQSAMALTISDSGFRTRTGAASIAGPRIRIWVYNAGSDYLSPFLPGSPGLSDKAAYLDLKTHWDWNLN